MLGRPEKNKKLVKAPQCGIYLLQPFQLERDGSPRKVLAAQNNPRKKKSSLRAAINPTVLSL